MIPVMQTKFGRGQGNCLLAAVASILHRQLESIPDFSASGCGWFDDLYEWCLNENIGLLCSDPKDFEHSIFMNAHAIGIFRVVGIPNENHAVILKCQRQELEIPQRAGTLRNRPTIQEMEAILDSEPTTPVHIRGDGTVVSWKWTADIVHNPNPHKNYELSDLLHLIFLIPERDRELQQARGECDSLLAECQKLQDIVKAGDAESEIVQSALREAREKIARLKEVEENLADYASRFFRLFDQYRGAWLREMGGVIRPKHWEIDGFVLRTKDIYEKAQLVDRMKQCMLKKVKEECTAMELFDAVFEMLAENGRDKIPTN